MYNEVVSVKEVVTEGKDITTVRFDLNTEVKAGQFMMVWIPGVDEIPMSVSYLSGGITVKSIGEATAALASLKRGDKLGIRGPYGNGWTIPEGKILCVGGGVGTAPIMAAAEAVNNADRIDIVLGARNSGEVIFIERAKSLSNDVRISTDDGSLGIKGTAVALADAMMKEKKYDAVLGCGPEIMNKYLLKACEENGVPVQLSLERIMKCGTGLCGSCAINGLRVCADGPVFTGDEVKRMSEFSVSKRDHAGRCVKL